MFFKKKEKEINIDSKVQKRKSNLFLYVLRVFFVIFIIALFYVILNFVKIFPRTGIIS